MLRASPRTTAGLHPWFCKCNWTVCRAANSKYTELSVRRFRPEISCSVPHRASGKAVPSLHPSSLFRVSGTQRIHFTTDAMTAPLTLTPKSIRNFQGECALTRNRSVPQECAACIHRMQNIRGLGTAQQAFWIWFLEIGFKNRAVVPRRTACRNYASFCYEVKCGKYTSLKGAQQKWFVRFRILDAVYNEYELKVDIVGKAEHHSTRNSRLKSSSLICW